MRRTISQPAPSNRSYEGLRAVVAAPDLQDLITSMRSRDELRRHTERALRPSNEMGWAPYEKKSYEEMTTQKKEQQQQQQQEANNITAVSNSNRSTPAAEENDGNDDDNDQRQSEPTKNSHLSYSVDEMFQIRQDQSELINLMTSLKKEHIFDKMLHLTSAASPVAAASSNSVLQEGLVSFRNANNIPSTSSAAASNNISSTGFGSPNSVFSKNNLHQNLNATPNNNNNNNASIQLAAMAAKLFSNNANNNNTATTPLPAHHFLNNHNQQQQQQLPSSASLPSPAAGSLPSFPPAIPINAPRKKYFQTGRFHQKILALLNKVSDDEEKFAEISKELVNLPGWGDLLQTKPNINNDEGEKIKPSSSLSVLSEENAEELRLICSHFLEKACQERKFVRHYARLAERIVSSQELRDKQNQQQQEPEKDENDKKSTSGKQSSSSSISTLFREQLLTRCERSFIGYFEKELEREGERRRRKNTDKTLFPNASTNDDDDELHNKNKNIENDDEKNEEDDDDDDLFFYESEEEKFEREAQKKKMIGVVRFAAELYLCSVIRPTVIQTIIVSLCAPIELYLDKQEGKDISSDAVYHLSSAQCEALHVLFECCGPTFATTEMGSTQGVPQALFWAELESISHPIPRAKFLMLDVKEMLYPIVHGMRFPPPPPQPPQSDVNSYVPPHKRQSQNQYQNNQEMYENNNNNNQNYDDVDSNNNNNNNNYNPQYDEHHPIHTDNDDYSSQQHQHSQIQNPPPPPPIVFLQPFSKERLTQTMSVVVETNDFSAALTTVSQQFDRIQFLVLWLKRCLAVNRCAEDRTAFPELLARCVESKTISRDDAKFIINKNIDYIIDEQLWEDVPNLWDNWATIIGVGTERLVQVENIDEEYRLNFDEEDMTNFNSSGGNNNHAYKNNNRNDGNDNDGDENNSDEGFKVDPSTGLCTMSTLLLHPAWHNHLLSRILSLPTTLYSVVGNQKSNSSENNEDDTEIKTNNEENDDDTENKQQNEKNNDYESRNSIMTIARRMIEGVVRYTHDHNPASAWNTPVFLWRSPNGAPPRICTPRFRFLAVLCKFASMNDLHIFVKSVVDASAALKNFSFEAQMFLSLVGNVRPNLNAVLAKHPHLKSPQMPMVLAASVIAACVTLKNEKYRSVPDWLLAAVDGKNRGMREALCLYEIASSGFWIESQTNYLSWGFRFVTFLRENRVVSDDVVEAVRSALNASLMLLLTTSNSKNKDVNNGNTNNGANDYSYNFVGGANGYGAERHLNMMTQIDYMLGPQLPSTVRRMQYQATKTIQQNQAKRIEGELQ